MAWQSLSTVKQPAIATATFADGFTVEIIRAELTPKLIYKPSRFVSWSLLSEGTTSAHSSLFFTTKEVNGSLSEASVEHQTYQPSLCLLLRAFHPDGTAFTSDHFIADEGKDVIKAQREGTRLTNGQKISCSNNLEQCGLLIESEDGVDGWLPLAGPIFADTQDAHALALRSPFPRTNPTLRLRFRTPGRDPVEASIPNPGYAAIFPSLKPEPLPVRKESTWYRIELTELHRTSPPTEKFSFVPIFRHEEKPPLHLVRPETYTLVEDMQGNPIFHSDGYTLLPGHKLARIFYTIRPEAGTFPWQPAEVLFIGTGVWNNTATMAEARITSEGKELGFNEIVITPSTAKWKHHKTQLPALMDIEIKCQGTAADWSRMQRFNPQMNVVLFPENESTPTGCTTYASAGWGTNSGSYHWFSRNSWSGTPKPNSQFRIALVPETKSTTFEFIVDVSTAPIKRVQLKKW